MRFGMNPVCFALLIFYLKGRKKQDM
uniref:Uncharacterized protein n=1 Tax=Anguilla anguilla TaxID=7936 RepID=A0A0E9XTB1_ANGAN